MTEFIFLEAPVDYVWHFASPASPIDYLELPIQTLKVGSLGTHKALGLAKHKRARFLLASTSEIYGDPLVHPQTEDYWGNVNPIGPRGCYDEAKRFAEALTMAYHKEHRVETRIVRIFNTYGPRMRLHDGRVVPAFISQALKHRPLTVFGRGQQTRSFCYVSDLIEGIYRLMMSAYDQPVNIGNPAEMTVLEFAKEIIRATGSRSRIVFRPLPQDDPRQRRPDITRARTDSPLGAQSPLGRRLVQDHRVFPGQSLNCPLEGPCSGILALCNPDARVARVLREVHPRQSLPVVEFPHKTRWHGSCWRFWIDHETARHDKHIPSGVPWSECLFAFLCP